MKKLPEDSVRFLLANAVEQRRLCRLLLGVENERKKRELLVDRYSRAKKKAQAALVRSDDEKRRILRKAWRLLEGGS